MADSNTAAKLDFDQLRGDELNSAMSENNKDNAEKYTTGGTGTCRTQDIYQLISTFISEARKAVPLDGIEYIEDTLGLHVIDGVLCDHRCDYRIRLGEEILGEISFIRHKEFSVAELAVIENLVAGLVMPLRHALRYQQTIRFALRDPLTGLRNGNACYDSIAIEIERARRYRVPFSLLLINLDEFGEINRRYGHAAGNAILVKVASGLDQEARNSDIIFRKGGDEFLVFLPNTAKSAALEAARRLKRSALAAPCKFEGRDLHFTTSIGVVTVLPDDSAFTIIHRADRALYHAKILGKDRIQAEPDPENMFQE